MRWKVKFYYEKKNDKENEAQTIRKTCGLKSLNCTPQVNKSDLLDMIKSVKFGKTKNHFQRKLEDDINTIHSTDRPLTFADKIYNFYKLKKSNRIRC